MRFANYATITQFHDHELTDGLTNDFIRNVPGDIDIITDTEEYVIEDISIIEFAQAIAKIQKASVITGYTQSVVAVENPGTPQLTLLINNEHQDGRATEAFRTCINVYSTGPADAVKTLFEKIEKEFPRKNYTTLQWWYANKGELEHMSMVLETKDKVYDEFYPWLKQGHANYFDDFMKSSAPLLFISGVPGSGKTSFIRANIARSNMNAYIGYDPKLFERDDMFISFLSSKRDHLMILEDSESVVLPRDEQGNSMMSRFLNVSDGLLRNNKKKWIFTTNESNFDRVDQALIRPGRCFDFIEFKRLSFEEAETAAIVAGLPKPTVHREYSLAELFNPTQRAVREFKFGFHAA